MDSISEASSADQTFIGADEEEQDVLRLKIESGIGAYNGAQSPTWSMEMCVYLVEGMTNDLLHGQLVVLMAIRACPQRSMKMRIMNFSLENSLILKLIYLTNTGWQLALVTPHNNNNNNPRLAIATKLGRGFDNLLLDSLYKDDIASRQIQLTNAGYGFGATATTREPASSNPNPLRMQQDIFLNINVVGPNPNLTTTSN
ncbi:hypothetical protein YC2023_035318 [Brassica napus]